MQTKITGVSRLMDKETGEVLNMFIIYVDNKEVPSLRMFKDGLKDVNSNAFKVYDSYLESCLFEAVSKTKEGRVYTDLLNVAVDTDNIVSLLLTNAAINVEFEKVDSLSTENTLGYFYKYTITIEKLDVDEYSKATMFETYKRIFADRSEAYLRFISKLLGVETIFYS